jgi:hypothetical protein
MTVEYIDQTRPTVVEKALRAGVGGSPQDLTLGGTHAAATITFSANITDGDTMVLNGVSVTANTSGSADTFAAGVDLPTTLGNLQTALNSTSASAGLQVATAVCDTSASCVLTYDTVGEVGNTYTFDYTGLTAAPTLAPTTMTGGQDTRVISVDTSATSIALTQNVDQALSLPNGQEHQEKTIVLSSKGGTGNAVITPTNLTGGTTLTLNAAGKWHKLIFIGGSWQAVAGTGTIA